MLKIYGSDLSSPANKVRFVANLVGIPYEYVRVNLREGEQRKPEFLKVNPVGKIPALNDNGFCLFESDAMCRYLADKSKSNLYPSDLQKRAIVDQWMCFVTIHVGGAISKVIYNRFFAPRIGVVVDEKSIEEGMGFLKRFLPIIEEQLSQHGNLTGSELSLADISLLAVLDPCEVGGIDLASYPKIIQWRNALKQKEFYTKCHKEFAEFLKQSSAK
jgi:glutathione S-transferase